MVSSLSNNRAGNIAPALVVLLHCFAQTTMAHATSSPAHSPAAFASPAAWIHPTTRIDRLRLGRQEKGINRRSVGRGHGTMPHMPPTLRHCRNNMQTGASFVSSLKSCMSPKAQGAPAADFELLGGRRKVKAVFTDVDGTLLGSDHQLADVTIAVLKEAIGAGIPVCMATGKARGRWVGMMRKQMGLGQEGWTLNGPGVFIQGLLVCNEQGHVVGRSLLGNDAVRKLNVFAEERGVTVVAYTTQDEIVCTETDEHTDILLAFSEPTPRGIGRERMDQLGVQGGVGVHKMMLMGEEEKLAALRSDLEDSCGKDACVTRAMDRMLEVLPFGASKASGVVKALELLGMRPGDCLAMGDGENDLEMLQMVRDDGGVAVAVGNAVPKLKAAAEFVVSTNDQGGAAEAISRFVLGKDAGSSNEM